MIRVYVLILFSLCKTVESAAQTLSNNKNGAWSHGVIKANLNQKWSLGLELTDRKINHIVQRQQWFIRPYVNYNLDKTYTLSLGYSRYKTFSYGHPAMFFMPIPEDHAWLQINSKHQKGEWSIQNRLRNEHRWVGLAERTKDSSGNTTDRIKGFDYRIRLRHMLLFTHPIIKNNEKTVISVVVGNEIFLNIGKFSGASLLNQNRIIAGFNYHFSPKVYAQVTYIHQNIWSFNNQILENNPVLRLSFYVDLNLYK